MFEVRRGLMRCKHSHLEMSAQDHVQVASAFLQDGRLHSLSGQPVPVHSPNSHTDFFTDSCYICMSYVYITNSYSEDL